MKSIPSFRFLQNWLRAALLAASCLFCLGCDSKAINSKLPADEISYKAIDDGEIWFRHSQMQLRFDNEMYCRVFFKKDGNFLSVNDIPPDPVKARPPHFLKVEGLDLRDFRVDYRNLGVSEIKTRFGTGKSLHLMGYAKTPSGIRIEKSLTVEFYHEYSDMALLTVTYRNLEKMQSVQIASTVSSFFRLDAARTKSGRPSYAFQGVQGKPEPNGANLFQITRNNFARTFEISSSQSGKSQAIPLLDLWNSEMGMAIGDISRQPQALVLPVKVAADQKIEISMESTAAVSLGPNEVLTTPKSFWMVHTGGMSAAFERYSLLVQPAR
jgi:alpha-galactosidase